MSVSRYIRMYVRTSVHPQKVFSDFTMPVRTTSAQTPSRRFVVQLRVTVWIE